MERHSIFLRDWHSNEAAISARVRGNWLIRCGHCGVSLGGHRVDAGPVTELQWRHDADTFFGSFIVSELAL